jgi:chromosomal replication initiator protein
MLTLNNLPPSIMTAQTAIKDILSDNQPVPVTIDRIINEVARTYNVMPGDIRSPKRSANISTARQVCAYVIREITQIPYNEIGDELGGRDHSTIVYQMKQAEANIAKNPRYQETIEDIIKNIRGS